MGKQNKKLKRGKRLEYKYQHATDWRIGTLDRTTGKGSQKMYWVRTFNEHGHYAGTIPFTGAEVRPLETFKWNGSVQSQPSQPPGA